jgi:hypothetical protein
MPATCSSSIASVRTPSISNSRLRRDRSLTSARDCISARPSSVLIQTKMRPSTSRRPFMELSFAAHPQNSRTEADRGCAGGAALLGSGLRVAQFTPQDLADGGLRQVGAELDHASAACSRSGCSAQ